VINFGEDAHMENVSILSNDEYLSGQRTDDDEEIEEIAIRSPWRGCSSCVGRLPTSGPTMAQNL
jgi:hypothetical protein